MKQSFFVTFNIEERRLGNADDLRGNILDSLGYPDWLEIPGALDVVQIPTESIKCPHCGKSSQ